MPEIIEEIIFAKMTHNRITAIKMIPSWIKAGFLFSSLEEAAVLLRNHKIGAIPVMKNDRLVGIITETTIFDAFIEIMGLREPGYRLEAYIKGNPPGILGQVATVIGKNGGNISHVSADVNDKSMARITLRFNREAAIDSIVRELEAIDVQVSVEEV